MTGTPDPSPSQRRRASGSSRCRSRARRGAMHSMSSATGLRTVLVVNDDQDLREAIHDALDDHGYPVHLASNGEDALAALELLPEPPGVILLDLMMPVMDGWQV